MKLKLFIKRNSATILSFAAVTGVIATAITTARATPKAIMALESAKLNKGKDLTATEKIRIAAPAYLPSILTGTATIVCIMGSNILNQHTQASIASAYALMNESYNNYRSKVKELYGEDADHKIIEAIAVDNAKHMYVNASYMFEPCDLSLDEENCSKPILWYEEYSKRFFKASLEQVLTAEYHVNRNYILYGSAILNDLYDLLGLDQTDFGEEMGWAPTDEGEFWIEFNHRKAQLDDGTVFYILEMPFEPRVNYDDYY